VKFRDQTNIGLVFATVNNIFCFPAISSNNDHTHCSFFELPNNVNIIVQ